MITIGRGKLFLSLGGVAGISILQCMRLAIMLGFCTMLRRLTYKLNRRFYLTGWLSRICINMVPDYSPPLEGWQAQPDGVVVEVLHNVTPFDPPAQSAVLSDGVVVSYLYKYGAGLFPSSGGVAGAA